MRPELSPAAARAIFVGREVKKAFKEGTFKGRVEGVAKNVPDEQGVTWPVLFKIKYEDGDWEELSLEEMEPCLVDRRGAEERMAAVLGAGGQGAEAPAADGAQRRRRRDAEEERSEGSNDENEAAAMAAVAAALGQAKKRRVLGEAAHNAGEERRSRRESKRKVDADFEYEDAARAAKRGLGAAAQQEAAIRSRFGLRQPGAAGAAAAAAGFATESEVPYPVGEGGKRLTGLPGHLKEIEVFNFMCHEHLKMEFAEHVTFISGANGSGKSAVLQALQVCLGVKATTTGRAHTFAQFIRTGCDEAVVRVTVWNKPYKGHDAFRHGLFGDSITVERRISRAGGSSAYALKDASGRIHGRKRDDLDAMLAALGLNAANPVCVMTQDTARNFLAGSSTKADQEKYALYMEATGLDQIAYSLEYSKGQIRQMGEAVGQIKEVYEKMKGEHEELRRSIAALEGIEGWRLEMEQLHKVLIWALVEEQEAGAAEVAEALQGLPQEQADAAASLEELQRVHAALQQAKEGKEHFIASFNERTQALLDEQSAVRHRLKQALQARRKAEAKLKQLQEALAEERQQKESLENAAKGVQDEVLAQTQAEVAAYRQELDDARAKEDAARQEVEAKEAAHKRATAATKAAARAWDDARSLCWGTDKQLRDAQQELQGLREAGKSKLAAFGGQAVVRLAEAIRREGGFSRPPIGPIGQYLTLEDSRWGLAVEAAMGFNFDAWLVNSMADCNRLRAMIKHHFQSARFQPSVFVVNFDLPAHSIPPGAQPPPDVPTIYRLLKCSDRQVASPVINTLVDIAHIEKVALAQDENAGKRIGYSAPNVTACFLPDGSKLYRRGSTQTFLPPPHWLRGSRLGQSVSQQITEMQQVVRQLQAELAQQRQEEERARQAVAAADAAEVETRRVLGPCKQREWQAKHAVTQLTQQPPEVLTMTQEEGNNEGVQADIWQATQACIELEQQLRDKQAELQHLLAAEAEASNANQDSIAARKRLEEENAELMATFDQEARQLAQAAEQLREAEEYAEDLATRQVQLERLREDKAAVVQELEEEAAQSCSREDAAEARAAVEARLRGKKDLSEEQVATLLTKEMLDKKARKLERKIADAEKEAGGTLDALQSRFEVSSKRMLSDGRRFEAAMRTHEVMEDAAKKRMNKLRELDHRLEEVINRQFRLYMWKKGHTGSIKLDRKARAMQLLVRMNTKAAGGGAGGRAGAGGAAEVRDLKQLSGGERSYTTVAFTLALGGQTEMPFRAMDEFDVFMDAINRRVAMQNLFSFAKDNPELQFIFLSPQDMAAVEDARQACQQSGLEVPDGFVRVVQMRAPRPNATTAARG